MGAVSLDQIKVSALSEMPVDGGNVLQGLRVTDSDYIGFGEVYFSWIEANFVKAWKRHREMTMNLLVPFGSVRFVFYDTEQDSARVETVGMDNYRRITVPPGIWFGFQGVSYQKSLVCNIANIKHHPEEADRIEIQRINFDWNK